MPSRFESRLAGNGGGPPFAKHLEIGDGLVLVGPDAPRVGVMDRGIGVGK